MKQFKLSLITLFAGLSLVNVSIAADAPPQYQSSCFACHGTGAAGAPKTGNKEAWAPVVSQGLDTLIASVRKGKGAMPPGGLCADCSDADLKNLIQFMSGHTFE